MPTILTDASSKSKRSRITLRAASPELAAKSAPPIGKLPKAAAEGPDRKRVTKHAQLLQLLSRPDGANIEDMMQATGWQQHSVRGFLAGTVKKKMGLALTSSKSEGDVRRYRIATRRGR